MDGPPYTTGRIHLGTAWNKIIKDSVLRYRSMNGYDLMDRPGWDMHGLPIEVKVESILGFKNKKDIEEYGVARFTEECKKFAIDNMHQMTGQFKRLGVWMDWDDPYMTLKSEYIEAAWWAIKQAYDKHLLERGLRNVNWCPRCETAIADSEVEYADRTDDSIYVKFPLKDEEGLPRHLDDHALDHTGQHGGRRQQGVHLCDGRGAACIPAGAGVPRGGAGPGYSRRSSLRRKAEAHALCR